MAQQNILMDASSPQALWNLFKAYMYATSWIHNINYSIVIIQVIIPPIFPGYLSVVIIPW